MLILVYFLSGGCVDDIVNNQTNHQFTSIILEHLMNSARACWIIRRTVVNVHVCLNHSWRYECKQFERHDEKQRHQRQFLNFSKFRQFLYLDVFCK